MLRRPTSLYVSLRTTGRVPFRSGACAEPTCHRDRNARAGRLSVLGLNALVSPPPGIPVEGCRRHRLPCICLLRNCQTSIEDAFLTPMRGASPSTAGGVPAPPSLPFVANGRHRRGSRGPTLFVCLPHSRAFVASLRATASRPTSMSRRRYAPADLLFGPVLGEGSYALVRTRPSPLLPPLRFRRMTAFHFVLCVLVCWTLSRLGGVR